MRTLSILGGFSSPWQQSFILHASVIYFLQSIYAWGYWMSSSATHLLWKLVLLHRWMSRFSQMQRASSINSSLFLLLSIVLCMRCTQQIFVRIVFSWGASRGRWKWSALGTLNGLLWWFYAFDNHVTFEVLSIRRFSWVVAFWLIQWDTWNFNSLQRACTKRWNVSFWILSRLSQYLSPAVRLLNFDILGIFWVSRNIWVLSDGWTIRGF